MSFLVSVCVQKRFGPFLGNGSAFCSMTKSFVIPKMVAFHFSVHVAESIEVVLQGLDGAVRLLSFVRILQEAHFFHFVVHIGTRFCMF